MTATKAILTGTGEPFTSLRQGFYAERAMQMVGHGVEAGEVRTFELPRNLTIQTM